ncbi:hypothetical protein [Marinagarivorans cellulosilyticus]|uniref:Uncharacterized protein n=1 Tax=Marinagarivorans cellulosilyticus TaxID=2721545 RepID=A0AAN2BJI0_9GAMM|nr:hypothetical protein [Marinagarivorans cellulosilyticus]BCD97035.1 hypothetical protein MARGE09_P1235 [Marinagarivorans cellulosilyticus]
MQMYQRNLARLTLCVASLFTVEVYADDLSLGGSVGFEHRHFFESPQYEEQSKSVSTEVVFEPELAFSLGRNNQFSFKGFVRENSEDEQRNHSDIRELYWNYQGDLFDLTVGVNKIHWGVVESLNVVNIINQIDYVEDISLDERLGQPMLGISATNDWGTISAYWLTHFRERTFPGEKGHFRLSLPVDVNNAEYSGVEKNDHKDHALRYSHYFGDLDVGLHWFNGIDRSPEFRVDADRLIPVYSHLEQFGYDFQYTFDAWLLKAEGVYKTKSQESSYSLVTGLEYTIFQFFGGTGDLGFLFEYLYDSREAVDPLFENDAFIGLRYVMNNVQDTTYLIGAIRDSKTSETVVNLEFTTRVGSQFLLEVNGIYFDNAEYSFQSFAKDSSVSLNLSWHF